MNMFDEINININRNKKINQNESIENLNNEQNDSKKFKLILNIFLVITWMVIVFLFSNQNSVNSTNTSTVTIKAILKVFNINIDTNNTDYIIENLQNITRKSAHFILYTLGGFLIYNLIYFLKQNILIYCKNKRIEKIIKHYNALITILFGILYAITDEIHQFFIPGRSCELRDVCIDTSGIILGVFLYILICHTMKIIKKVKK